MSSDTRIYPAHYRDYDDTIQTVEEHLTGVKNLCCKYTAEVGFHNTGILTGLLHDIGKFSDEFCTYISTPIQNHKDNKPEPSKTVDHGKHGAILVLERYHKGDAYQRVTSEIIAMLLCYHHGGLEDYISEDLDIKLWIRCGQSEDEYTRDISYIQAKEKFFDRIITPEVLDELFNASVAEFQAYIDKGRKAGIFSYYDFHLLIKYLYSCLIDADRYDTYLFMQDKQEDEDIDIQELWSNFSQRLKVKEEYFRQYRTESELEEKIRQLRLNIWQHCNDFGSKPPGIYTLTVPTGGGKTLSSLRYALNHAMMHGKKRIIYVLPFMTIIEQNAGVVRDVLDAGEYLLEHHSNVVFDDEEEKDELKYRRLLTEQWTSPIIFTTMVQFLNTFYSGGTRSIRRMHNITDSILIFDEIQALPTKCISLFNEAINFLASQCRNTIILCSATQPSLNMVKRRINVSQEIIPDIQSKFNEFKRMEIIDSRYQNRMSLAQLGDFISGIKRDNDSILIVLNTKAGAEAVYKEAKQKFEGQDIEFYFLSTNLCPDHRKKVIKDLKDSLESKKHVICISTQLIEAGVDISFSCVVRHIAGLDSIAQASGRGNRHGEGSIRSTYIIQLEDERLGSLKEISLGEVCTAFVLDEYNRDRERFDNDLLSPKAISRYYYFFFNETDIHRLMDYPVSERDGGKGVKHADRSIYDMLNHPNVRSAYSKAHGGECPVSLEYQFGAAARNFEVIDKYTIPVLVPFEEGKNIISRLTSQERKLPDMKLIKSAQPYMVNITENLYRILRQNQAVIIDKISGILFLNERFYDYALGVMPEGGMMKDMQFG